jgi:HlyD family secretion protein
MTLLADKPGSKQVTGPESDEQLGRQRRSIWRGWARNVWKLLVLLLVAAVALYWFMLSPLPVAEHQLERGQIVADVMGTGTLEPRVKATISPKISGRIKEVLADQGDRVVAGKLMVRLDDEELNQQVEIAKANVDSARATIDRLKADKDRALAVFSQARLNYSRVQKLVTTRAASGEEMDKATEGINVAEAGVSHAEAASVEGQTNLIAAQRTLEYHRARLADTMITAPFDGLVVRRHRDPGDVAVPGSPVLTLISTDELWVTAWVDETELAKVQAGQPARVVFRSAPDRSYPGQVARLGRETDRETREFIVDVRILELPDNWTVGQRAEAFIEIARKSDVTLLPASYLVWRDDVAGVFVNQAGRAAWRPVKVGLRNQEKVEVLEGLAAGDTVVVPSTARTALTDGRRISSP